MATARPGRRRLNADEYRLTRELVGTEEVGLRERKKRDTRIALSDAALELAFERGLDEVTRDEIAARAGVSLRTMNNYFTNKYEAAAYLPIQWIRRSLDAMRQRPVDEPLWTSITAAALHTLEESGGGALSPTGLQQARVRKVVDSPEMRWALSKNAFADLLGVVGERTGTDPNTDLYPRLVAAVVRAVAETAVEVYVRADPPVDISTVLEEGFAAVATGLARSRPR